MSKNAYGSGLGYVPPRKNKLTADRVKSIFRFLLVSLPQYLWVFLLVYLAVSIFSPPLAKQVSSALSDGFRGLNLTQYVDSSRNHTLPFAAPSKLVGENVEFDKRIYVPVSELYQACRMNGSSYFDSEIQKGKRISCETLIDNFKEAKSAGFYSLCLRGYTASTDNKYTSQVEEKCKLWAASMPVNGLVTYLDKEIQRSASVGLRKVLQEPSEIVKKRERKLISHTGSK